MKCWVLDSTLNTTLCIHVITYYYHRSTLFFAFTVHRGAESWEMVGRKGEYGHGNQISLELSHSHLSVYLSLCLSDCLTEWLLIDWLLSDWDRRVAGFLMSASMHTFIWLSIDYAGLAGTSKILTTTTNALACASVWSMMDRYAVILDCPRRVSFMPFAFRSMKDHSGRGQHRLFIHIRSTRTTPITTPSVWVVGWT